MKYEDYEGIAQKLTAENAPEVLKTMLDAVKEDLAERDTLKTVQAEQEAKIKDLQDTNIKLFLSQTGKAEQDEDTETEEEKVEKMDLNEYLNYIKESEEK